MLKSDGSKTSLACAPTPTARTPIGTRHVIFIVARCCYQLREYRTTWQRVRGQLLVSSSQRRVEVWGAKGSALGGSVRNDIDPSAARLAVSIQSRYVSDHWRIAQPPARKAVGSCGIVASSCAKSFQFPCRAGNQLGYRLFLIRTSVASVQALAGKPPSARPGLHDRCKFIRNQERKTSSAEENGSGSNT
jgi:hypothetical protein